MALENGHIIRLNLDEDKELEDIEICPPGPKAETINKLFMDPTGHHVILSLSNDDTVYLPRNSTKPKLLPRAWKGVEAIAWERNESLTDNPTALVLVGTKAGQIFESSIGVERSRLEKFRALYNGPEAITGLFFERFPEDNNKLLVVSVTATKMFQFVGSLELAFKQPRKEIEIPQETYFLQQNQTKETELHLFTPRAAPATCFAWMTTPGIFYSDLELRNQTSGTSVFSPSPPQSFPYPEGFVAQSIILTEFHFLILYPTTIQAISKLTLKLEWEYSFPEKMVALVFDPAVGVIAYSSRRVYEILIKEEDRKVSEQYLELDNPNFRLALKYAKKPAQKHKVWAKKAQYDMKAGRYDDAAKAFAESSASFEYIGAKFVKHGQFDSLRLFLKLKLKTLAKRDSTQYTMLATWLCVLYLNKLIEVEEAKKDLEPIRSEFHQFLRDYQDRLDTKTTFHLLASHGRIKDLLFYAEIIGDIEKLVQYYIQHGFWKRALDALDKQNEESLYYKHCPLLMEKIPQETVNLLIKKPNLSPRLLLPAIMRYENRVPETKETGPRTEEHQGIRYLQDVVSKKRSGVDISIYNYLLYLYAKHCDEQLLLNFLKQKETIFDLQYALRLCSENDKQQARVVIYSKMGLYEEAVDAALEMKELGLAKEIANVGHQDDFDKELRKKLWLRIARCVVEEEKNISKAIAFLHDSSLLQIEDILPFFPPFTKVDDFKDDVCESLKGYNQHLEDLQHDMKEATDAAELIREDIQQLRENYVIVDANQKCELCKYPTLTRTFYVFPCGHSFHGDCLEEEVQPYLTREQNIILTNLRTKLMQFETPTMNNQPANSGGEFGLSAISDALSFSPPKFTFFDDGPSAAPPTPQPVVSRPPIDKQLQSQLRDQLDALIANECPLCNSLMVKLIEKPFVDPENAASNDTWKIPTYDAV